MSAKVEAKRFSGKPEQWDVWTMAIKAHFLKEDLLEFFNDGSSYSGEKKKEWKKAQRGIYAFIIMTCDDRAATTLLSVPVDQDAVGWEAYSALRDKYGGEKDQQLSKATKKFLKRKQRDDESRSAFLSDMRAKITKIEAVATDKAKIWDVMKATTLIQNLADNEDTKLTKKLVHNRMAEAEQAGAPLSYDQIEAIIENDGDDGDDEAQKKQTKKPSDPPDIVMYVDKGKGKGKGKWQGKGLGRGLDKGGYNSYGGYGGYGGRGGYGGYGGWHDRGGYDRGYGKGKGKHEAGGHDTAAALEEKKARLKAAQDDYNDMKKKTAADEA